MFYCVFCVWPIMITTYNLKNQINIFKFYNLYLWIHIAYQCIILCINNYSFDVLGLVFNIGWLSVSSKIRVFLRKKVSMMFLSSFIFIYYWFSYDYDYEVQAKRDNTHAIFFNTRQIRYCQESEKFITVPQSTTYCCYICSRMFQEYVWTSVDIWLYLEIRLWTIMVPHYSTVYIPALSNFNIDSPVPTTYGIYVLIWINHHQQLHAFLLLWFDDNYKENAGQ